MHEQQGVFCNYVNPGIIRQIRRQEKNVHWAESGSGRGLWVAHHGPRPNRQRRGVGRQGALGRPACDAQEERDQGSMRGGRVILPNQRTSEAAVADGAPATREERRGSGIHQIRRGGGRGGGTGPLAGAGRGADKEEPPPAEAAAASHGSSPAQGTADPDLATERSAPTSHSSRSEGSTRSARSDSSLDRSSAS